MTSATIQAKIEPPTTAAATGPKRRRRAPATGATEDCHACRKARTSCDRRRPYCSQCLDQGKECSGYRTTLTWGVGVASRGKLRGLSLPIANSADPNPSQARQISTTMDSPRSRKRQRDPSCKIPHGSKRPSLPHLHTAPQAISGHQLSWQIPDWGMHRPVQDQPHSLPLNLYNSYVPFVAPHPLSSPMDDSSISSSTSSLHSAISATPFRDNFLNVANEYSSTPNDVSFIDPYLAQYSVSALQPGLQPMNTPFGSLSVQHGSPLFDDSFWPSAGDAVSSDLGAPKSLSDLNECGSVDKGRAGEIAVTSMVQMHSFSSPLTDTDVPLGEDERIQGLNGTFAHPWHSIERALPVSSISPEIHSLLDFYDRAICPVLVAFDGPSNPYRMYVMPLALQNRGLQNAIAALATNNIRMRRLKTVPSLKGAPELASSQMAAVIGKPTAEEQVFKGNSIELLNAALASASAAQDDAVLATLLILCLFHVCDSGFSKFKTQLAGVQKLLRMRGTRCQSDFVGWVEMFFAWFDVMTSAVNDRETQIQGDSLDLVNLSDDLGALEQFSGCEGRLFKVIARLGRLNLLSQRREVRQSPFPRANVHLHEEKTYEIADSEAAPDDRHEFWREWRELRGRLVCWELDEMQSPQMCEANLPGAHHDLLHISESFRYSALLYTERLACPSIPSSSRNLQNLVAQALYHISEIGFNSCVLKFMLWPLFITGTECVDEEHRDLIRRLCVEIQKESGFYNNVSGLEVLERVWREGNGAGSAAQAFRWRDAMPRVDGEYIVI